MKVIFRKFWATSDKEVFVNGESVGLMHVTKHGWGSNKSSPSQSWVFRVDIDSALGRKIASKMKVKAFDRYDYYKDIKADFLNAVAILEDEQAEWDMMMYESKANA